MYCTCTKPLRLRVYKLLRLLPCVHIRSRGIVFCCQFVCLRVCALFFGPFAHLRNVQGRQTDLVKKVACKVAFLLRSS